MNELIPVPASPDLALMTLTPAARLEMALSLVQNLAHNVIRLSQVAYAMKRSGDDLAPLRRQLGTTLVLLLRVGCGQVFAGTYLCFGGNPDLYRPISRLDLGEQQRLADGGRIRVVVFNAATKEYDVRDKDPLDLDAEEIKRVFGRDEIRTEAQQRAILDRHVRDSVISARTETVGKIKVDKARDGIVLHGFASRSDVKRALRLLEG